MTDATSTLKPKGIAVKDGDEGRAVIYRAAPNYAPEQGYITSWNDKYIFVRYGNKSFGEATLAEDLDWLSP